MLENTRNFVIISHIDHGKSTLADRFLEMTGAVSKEKMREQFLDSMDLEREKGITIKMHPVRLNYQLQILRQAQDGEQGRTTTNYQLNLIDTPGHIDFSYEISRALACVEGALLLVDATKGIQAQTIFNLSQAQEQDLKMIAAVNKIDLPQAQVEQTKRELANILNIQESEIFCISGKTGQGVEELLCALIEKVPPPSGSEGGLTSTTPRALIFDSKYDSFSGVVAYVRVFEGQFQRGDKIKLLAANCETEIKEVGYFAPELSPCPVLQAGEIGYVKTGIKTPDKVRVGDTITKSKIKNQKSKMDTESEAVKALPGYKEPQMVLFLSLYPEDPDDFELLKDSLEKLKLNDGALNFTQESKLVLGRGFRMGFLGSLHAEITVRRLESEFGLDVVATSPQVMFQVFTKNNRCLFIASPSDWPDPSQIEEVKEPWVELEIVTPNSYLGPVLRLLQNFKANLRETRAVTIQKSILLAQAPLREIVSGNFYDRIKSVTQGYASFGFKPLDYRKGNLVKLDILIAGKTEEAFARIVSHDEAYGFAKEFLRKLKQALPQQQFPVALQAVLSGKVIARENLKARRKDVTAPLYGGDVTRKRKLLDIQKRGKKELKAKGKVKISAQAFLELLSR